MSDFEQMAVDEQGLDTRTSRLAVASLVSSLVCCIPVTTIAGAVLGIVSVVRISMDPTLRGRGLALAATVLGVLFTGGHYVIYQFAIKPVWLLPTIAMQAGLAGDIDAFRAQFHGAAAGASDAETLTFLQQVQDRYGEFRRAEPRGQAPDASPGSPVVPFVYVLEFEGGQPEAKIAVVFSDPKTGRFVGKLESIRIIDADRGDLVFPVAGDPSAPAVSGAVAPDRSSRSSPRQGETGSLRSRAAEDPDEQ